MLREKNEKCLSKNRKWTETQKEWIEFKVEKEKTIQEWKKKDEEKKNIIDELKSRHKAEKEAIFRNETADCKKMKNEIEVLKNELNKLARFVNIFGKNEILNKLNSLHNLKFKSYKSHFRISIRTN